MRDGVFSSMEIKAEGMDGVPARPVKERKKHDRFNGMSEEEVARRTLPDHLAENLDIIIVSMIDTHLTLSAFESHHHASACPTLTIYISLALKICVWTIRTHTVLISERTFHVMSKPCDCWL